MTKKAKDFSLGDDAINSFNLEGSDQSTKARENLDSLAQGEGVIHLDIDAKESLVKIVNDVEKKSKANNGKAKYLAAYRKLHSSFSFKRRVPIRARQTFYELMAVMLEAGIPLVTSVKVYIDQAEHPYFKQVCEAIVYRLEKGDKLSQALADYPKIFDTSELGIIAAGEETGRLVESFKRLAAEVEKSDILRRKVRGALIYPGIVLVFVGITVFVLLRFVVPQISQLFVDAGQALPLITQIVIDTSAFVVDYSLEILALVAGVLLLNFLIYQNKKVRYQYHYLFLHIPLFKGFLKEIEQARFTRSLANLIASGVGIIRALEITAGSMGNLVYEEKIRLLSKDVANGISIGDGLSHSPYFSPMLISMVSVSEKTAQIDTIALKLANYYTTKVYNSADNLTKVIQPVIIGVVGAIVGVIVIAIMLPMTEILSAVSTF